MRIKHSAFFLLFIIFFTTADAQRSKLKIKNQTTAATSVAGERWSVEKANAWYDSHKWLTGADYIPNTAINQLEMWQADTFDPQTIDKELGWAEGIGFNTMRVFLHSIAWKSDPEGFKKREINF